MVLLKSLVLKVSILGGAVVGVGMLVVAAHSLNAVLTPDPVGATHIHEAQDVYDRMPGGDGRAEAMIDSWEKDMLDTLDEDPQSDGARDRINDAHTYFHHTWISEHGNPSATSIEAGSNEDIKLHVNTMDFYAAILVHNSDLEPGSTLDDSALVCVRESLRTVPDSRCPNGENFPNDRHPVSDMEGSNNHNEASYTGRKDKIIEAEVDPDASGHLTEDPSDQIYGAVSSRDARYLFDSDRPVIEYNTGDVSGTEEVTININRKAIVSFHENEFYCLEEDGQAGTQVDDSEDFEDCGIYSTSITFQVIADESTIQGLKEAEGGLSSTQEDEIEGREVQIDDGSNGASSENPFSFTVPSGERKVSVNGSDYDVRYEYCINEVVPECDSLVSGGGDSFTADAPSDGYVDVRFYFSQPPPEDEEETGTIRGKKVDEEHNTDSSEPWYSNTVTVEGGDVRQLDSDNPFSFTDLPTPQEYQVSVEGEDGYATSWIYCSGDGSVNRVEQDGTCEESGTTATSGDGTSFSVQLQTDEIIDVRFIFNNNPNEPDHKIYGANHIHIPQKAYRDNKNFGLDVRTYLWPNAGLRGGSGKLLWLAGIWGDDSGDTNPNEGRRDTDPNTMTRFNTEAEEDCPDGDDCLRRVPMAYVPHSDDNNDNGNPYSGRQDGSSTPRGNNWRKIREEVYGTQSHRLVRSCGSYNDGRYNTYCGGIASDLTDSIDGETGNHIKNVEVSNIRVRGHRPDALLEDDAFEFQGDVNDDKLQPHAQGINLPGQGPITSPAWDNIRKPSTGLLNGSITDNRFLFSNPGFGSPKNFDDDPESVGRSEYTNRSKKYADVEATTLLQLDADANEESSSSGDTLTIGEAGTFTAEGGGDWTTINFTNDYMEPVVVGTSNSHNGGQKALVFETRNVGSGSAQMRFCEGEGSNSLGCDTHLNERLGYMVVDASKTDSVKGIEAGRFRIDSEMDTKSTTVNFENETFDNTPIVLTAPHTSNGISPVETRAWNISTTNFTGAICQMKLGDQYNCDEGHVEEEVGWVAVEPGSGPFHERSEANSTGKVARNSEPVTVNFTPDFSGSPVVIVEQQTEDGPQESEVDEAYDVTSSSAKVRYCEMESDPDDCHSHVTEDIGWLALGSGELTADSSEEDDDNDQPLYDANREPLTYTATLDKLRRVDLVWDEYVDWNQVDDKGHWYTRKTRRATGVDRGEPDDDDVAHLEDPDRGTAEEDEHYHCDWHYADHDGDGDKERHCHKQWEDEHCDWERYRDGVGYRYNNKSYYDDRTRSRYGWYNTQTTTRSMPYGRDGETAQSAFWFDYSDQPPWSHANVKNFWQDQGITSMDNANSSNKPSHSSRWIYNTSDPAYTNRHFYTDWERPRFKTSWYYEYSSACMYDNGSFDDYEEDVDTHYHNAEKVYEDTEDWEIDGHVYGKYGNEATFDGDSDGQIDYRWSWSSNRQRVRYENSYDRHYRKLGPRFRVTSNDQYRLRGVEGNREMRGGRDIAYIYNPTVSASEGDIFAADNIHSYFQTSQAGSAFLFSDSQIVNFDSSGSQYEGYQIHDSPNRVDAYYPSGGHEASNDPVRYIFRNYDELTDRAGFLSATRGDRCSDHRSGSPSTSGNFNLERGDRDTIRDNIYLSDGDMRIGRTRFRNTAGTIIVEGDLCIEGDITYGGSGNERENVPSVGFIVHGHIVIEDDVTRLNGSYFSGGEIYTGSRLLDVTRVNSNDRRIGWEPNNDREVDGDRPLRLDGLMVANSYVLARQPSGSANRSGARAESFNYDGRVVINPPPGFSRVFTADAVWNDTVPRN